MKLIPAGTSKRTGKPYSAFYACTSYNCKETAPAVNEEPEDLKEFEEAVERDDSMEESRKFGKEMEEEKEENDDESPMRKSDWRRKDEMIARIAISKEFIKRGEDFDNAVLNSDLEKWMHFVLTGKLK